jgi:hypothetical protein
LITTEAVIGWTEIRQRSNLLPYGGELECPISPHIAFSALEFKPQCQ